VAQQFYRTVSGLWQQPRSVSAYAAQLGVSVTYLNETVRQATGRTPAQLIRQMQALEAKRLLVQTEMSVVQIARGLGFADPAYFSRFFRREAGISPGEFRQHWENHHDHLIASIDPSDCSK
jgi:AraC-like DNA-binding protein